MAPAQARTLVYVPVIHTEADMGALGKTVQHISTRRLGRRGWKRNANRINQMWVRIGRAIQRLELCYTEVRLYQDGLPVCGRELEIARELAEAGSRNHGLLLQLVDKGATLMGTESPELLVEEYGLIKQTLAIGARSDPPRMTVDQERLSDSLLRRRDEFIARRINTTLCIGDTGILFVGMLHSVENLLAGDICVVRVVEHLAEPGRSSVER